ncbi:tetratricopeptide repeat protein [Candidatus Omnitrophota bacterium]
MPEAKLKQSPANRPNIKTHIFVCILIAIIVMAVYANSLKGEFFWDDLGLIKDNFLIKDWKYLPQLFLRPLSSTFHYCYRPLLNLSFMIDYSIWQLNPLGYHISAVIIHILNSFLVYLLAYSLSRDFKLAISAGLIFSVHTVLSEPVNYLSSRADLLMGLFCISSLIFYIIHRTSSLRRPVYLFGSLFFFILGLLSKEMAIVLIFTIILYELILRSGKETNKRRLSFILPYLFVLIIYATARFFVLKANIPVYVETFSIAELSFASRFFTSITAIPTYVRLLFIPIGLHKEWLLQPLDPVFQFVAVFSVALVAGALLFAKFIYRYSKISSFGILWFFVLLTPVLNIIPINSFLSEAWLYLPSIGFILFVCALVLKIVPGKTHLNKSILVFVLICVLSFYSFLTVKRNHVWASERQLFFTEISEFNPYSSRAYTNLGLIYVEQNKLPEAIEEFVKALEIEPDSPGLHRNMGNVYLRLNKLDLAEKAYRTALSINPNDAETLGNLGNLYSNRNNLEEAIGYIKKAISVNAHNANFYNSLGTVYFKQNKLSEAVSEYKKALDISPDNAKAHTNLGIIYFHQQDLDKAVAEFKESIRVEPNYIDAYYNLGVISFRLGQYEKAKDYLNKAISLSNQQNKKTLAQNAETLLKQIP